MIPSALNGHLWMIEYADVDSARGMGMRGANETEGAWGVNAGVESMNDATHDVGGHRWSRGHSGWGEG